MNIFYLDHDPVMAARYQVDKHVVKMTMETAQLLCCAHYMISGEDIKLTDPRWGWLLGLTHKNHPCAKWTRESGGNYMWLWLHGQALLDEYTFRYKREHDYRFVMKRLAKPPLPLVASLNERTPVRLAMPDEYKHTVRDGLYCPVQSYRAYYKHGKKDLHTWTRRPVPDWIK